MADPSVQVTVLKDNVAARPGLLPGHGLALLVEAAGARVLFDTGPDESVVHNAGALGLSLRPLDAIVLSHGHFDHSGGLAAVLAASGPVPVIAQAGVFDSTFSGVEPTSLRHIGMPLAREGYEALGAQFDLSERPVPLGPLLTTSGRLAALPLCHEQRQGLWRQSGAAVQPDDFRDECALLAALGGCRVVMTGCAHLGGSSIVRHARGVVPGLCPTVLLGGLHLGAATEEHVAQLAREAEELGVTALLPCHCTGLPATAILAARFAGRVRPLGTGTVVRIEADGATEIRHAPG